MHVLHMHVPGVYLSSDTPPAVIFVCQSWILHRVSGSRAKCSTQLFANRRGIEI